MPKNITVGAVVTLTGVTTSVHTEKTTAISLTKTLLESPATEQDARLIHGKSFGSDNHNPN